MLDRCVNGPAEVLDTTAVSQPAIFVASMAAVEKMRQEEGDDAVGEATVTMGLSLGEYSALCYAGAISFEDGVRITKARGEAMQAASGFEEKAVVDVLENFVWSFDGTAAYLNWATWTINHDPSNARLRFEPVRGCEGISNNAESNCEADQVFMMGYATKDLEPGQELLMDYAAFSMPEFYSEFAKSRGFVHVRDKVVQP